MSLGIGWVEIMGFSRAYTLHDRSDVASAAIGLVVGRASYGGVSLAAGREGHRMQIENLLAGCVGRKDRGYDG